MNLDDLKSIMGWLTPTAAYAALAVVGLSTIWQYLQRKKTRANGSPSESGGSGGVDMAIIEQLRGDIQRIFDKIDELQKMVMEQYATKEEVEAMRKDLRDTRDRVIRLEAERDAMKAQIAALPKRTGD